MNTPTDPAGLPVIGVGTSPRARGWIHRVAFLVAVPAGLVLLVLAPSAAARLAVAIYAASLVTVFWVSSTYHLGVWSAEEFVRWQRRDHAAIFLLIAGSYTPYCVLALEGPWRVGMLAAVWVGAWLGILVKLYRVDLHVLSGFMYLGLGWAAVIVFPQFVRALGPAPVILTVVGGLLYSLGALVLAIRRPKLFPRTFGYHEVWHAATAAAAACHYTAVLLMVIEA
ncbi:MAG TPA: hemolysin III family protein, partial [Actinomycetota bacterium]|nr:hemolysin III family protein [Actinomycetota bacterium]